LKVIVTGAAGFMGSAFVRWLQRLDHTIIQLDRSGGDIADARTWQSLPPADHVIHFAGRSFVPDSWQAPADFYATNAVGAARALEYCRRTGAHLVFVSGYVYGIPQSLPINEDHPLNPSNPYALSKVLAERICVFHAESQNAPVTIVRPFNIFGPGQRGAFLIPTIFEQIVAGGQIRVKDVMPRRDYIFVDDLSEGIASTLEMPRGLRVFNFGSGVSLGVLEIIELAQNVAGSQLPVVSEQVIRENEIADVRADITRAGRDLGWKPRHTFLAGLSATFESLRASAS
jgi:GDP-4-dehydro-6-deoxy-D-mannose reductase